MIVEIISSLCVGYLLWSIIAMEINHRRASKMEIPLIRLPVDPLNIIWLILEPYLWRLLDQLPLNFGSFSHYSRRGWYFHDKASSHLKYGPIFALVTPCDIYVHIADHDAIHEVLTRRGDFLRPSKMYTILEVYGPCISTAGWTDWPRHRKVLAAPFNENIMKFVWQESIKQAREMLTVWTQNSKPQQISTAKDTRTLSLNILAATGFRKSYNFRSSDEAGVDKAGSYRDALQTVLDNVVLIMVIPSRYLLLPFMPKSWKRVGRAAAEFKKYMEDMFDEETASLKEGKVGNGTLMTSFVRALGIHQKEKNDLFQQATKSPSKGLTIDEVFGNIFIINFAGHDTTANTLAFSMILLAAHPEVQDWIAQELREVIKDPDNEILEYEKVFEHLPRCKAVLHETLRQFPPIMALPKWSNDKPQRLQVGEKAIIIPPRVGVTSSILGIQMHPKYWENPLHWDPSRWITSSPDPNVQAGQLNAEKIITPARSTFFPWSDGPQNCPGQKFSQVEFVAVLAILLRNHRVSIIQNDGESFERARERALAVTQDCDMELLLRMRNADKVRLAWRKV